MLYRVDWYVVIDVSTVQDPEDEGTIMIIRNVGNCIPFDVAEYPRSPESFSNTILKTLDLPRCYRCASKTLLEAFVKRILSCCEGKHFLISFGRIQRPSGPLEGI
jgi:hypothetical protein